MIRVSGMAHLHIEEIKGEGSYRKNRYGMCEVKGRLSETPVVQASKALGAVQGKQSSHWKRDFLWEEEESKLMDQLGCSSTLSGGQRWLFDNTYKVVAKVSKGSYWDRKSSSEGRMAGGQWTCHSSCTSDEPRF